MVLQAYLYNENVLSISADFILFKLSFLWSNISCNIAKTLFLHVKNNFSWFFFPHVSVLLGNWDPLERVNPGLERHFSFMFYAV